MTEAVFHLLADIASTKAWNSDVFREFTKVLLLSKTYRRALQIEKSNDLWVLKARKANVKRVDELLAELTDNGTFWMTDDPDAWREIHEIVKCIPPHLFEDVALRYMDALSDTRKARGFMYHLMNRGFRTPNALYASALISGKVCEYAIKVCEYDFVNDPDDIVEVIPDCYKEKILSRSLGTE